HKPDSVGRSRAMRSNPVYQLGNGHSPSLSQHETKAPTMKRNSFHFSNLGAKPSPQTPLNAKQRPGAWRTGQVGTANSRPWRSSPVSPSLIPRLAEESVGRQVGRHGRGPAHLQSVQ